MGSKLFHFIMGPIRAILAWFDAVIYGFIPTLYKLMLYLANIDIVSNNVPVQALIQRIYILVGVFMLFRLSFSIMNYIVNPDAFSDQSKGFTNLVKRVVLAIVLLVSIPWIFQELYVAQGKIITSGIIPRLVLGESGNYEDKGNIEKVMDTSAKDVQFLLFGPFYSLNYNASDLKVCMPTADNSSKHILGTVGMASDEECLNKVAEIMDSDDTIIASGVNIKDFFRYKGDGGDNRDFSQFVYLASWTLSDGSFAINYYPIISTLCGGYLVFLLLSFCIDIAGRIIRLLFLQILSPIAVISSIDPTSSGDRLKEWAKECLKVWASLFLRMLIIFLIIQLVRVVTNTLYEGVSGFSVDGLSNKGGVNVWIYIFLILGIFNAAGKIPELIEKATGIKMSGELQLNPFKALSENVGLQKGLGLATGVGIGAIGAATGAGIGRIFSGAYQGLTGKNALDVQKRMVEGNRTMRNARSDGSTFGGRLRARATNFFGNQGALGKIEDEKVEIENENYRLKSVKSDLEQSIQPQRDAIKRNSEVISAIDAAKSRATEKAKQDAAIIVSSSYANNPKNSVLRSYSGRSFVQLMSEVQAKKAQAEQNGDSNLMAEAITLENAAQKWAATEGAQAWGVSNAGQSDAELYSHLEKYRTSAADAGLEAVSMGADLWKQQDDLKFENADLSSSISEVERRVRDIDSEINSHQMALDDIDRRHRSEQSNYTATGGQSGGVREPNATNRADAGQWYGFGNMNGGQGPHGPGGPYGPRP